MTTKIILNELFVLDDFSLNGDVPLVRSGITQPDRLRLQAAATGTTDYSVLIKFDLSPVPQSAKIVSAKLNLWLDSADNVLFTTALRRVIYRMLRTDWSEEQSSWTNAQQAVNAQASAADSPWGLPGASEPGVDHEPDPVYDETEILDVPHTYYEFEVGGAVQKALNDRRVGLLMERAGDPLDSSFESYMSREGAISQNRSFGSQTAPFLVIEFEDFAPEGTPVPVPRIDYTSRDHVGTKADLVRLIPFFNPSWTDHNETDLGITLLNHMSYLADVAHYHIDRAIAERFPDFMVLSSSLANLAKISGTSIDPPVPARVNVTFTLSTTTTLDTTIPQGTQCSATIQDGTTVFFETDVALVIPAGQLAGTVSATEGETITDDPIGISNGDGFQEFQGSRDSYLAGTMRFFVDDGANEEEWTLVEALATQLPSAKVFEVSVDGNALPKVRTGDNVEGKIPPLATTLSVVYRVGGGSRGNVSAAAVSSIVSPGLPSGTTVTNIKEASGGANTQSIGSARQKIFRFITTNDRAATLRDFASIALNVQGVSKAIARKNPDTIDPTDVEVIIAPNGGGTPTETLLQSVTDEISSRSLIGIQFTVVGFTSVRINLTAEVRVLPTFRREGVEEGVREAIRREFGFDTQDFGTTVRLSRVNQVIEDVTGVDYVEISRLSRVPEVVLKGWSGTATFSDVDISSMTKEEEWMVTLISPVTFRVEGSVGGVQENTGTFDEPYISDDGEVTFTIFSGSQGNAAGDRAVFLTSPLVASVDMEEDEIAARGQLRLTFNGGIT